MIAKSLVIIHGIRKVYFMFYFSKVLNKFTRNVTLLKMRLIIGKTQFNVGNCVPYVSHFVCHTFNEINYTLIGTGNMGSMGKTLLGMGARKFVAIPQVVPAHVTLIHTSMATYCCGGIAIFLLLLTKTISGWTSTFAGLRFRQWQFARYEEILYGFGRPTTDKNTT